MATTAKVRRARTFSVTRIDVERPIRTMLEVDSPRRNVENALAQESTPQLAESIRIYARCSRANGDSVQDVLEVLMNLVRDSTPQTRSLAKRSCEVADVAVAAYFSEPVSTPAGIWRSL